MELKHRIIISIVLGLIAALLGWFVFFNSGSKSEVDHYPKYITDKLNLLENRIEQIEKDTNIVSPNNATTQFLKDTIDVKLTSDKIDDKWYLKYFLPALLTLMIGILSFFLTQMYLRRIDDNKAKDKYVGILKVLSEEIKRNLDLECQLHAYLYVGIIPTFGLSFFITDNIFSDLTSVCINYDLLKKIFHKYFEYRHIQNRLDKTSRAAEELYEAKKDNSDQTRLTYASWYYSDEKEGTYLLIQGNIKGSFEIYNEIVREINSYDKKSYLFELPNDYLEKKYYEFQTHPDIVKATEHKFGKDYLGKRDKFFK